MSNRHGFLRGGIVSALRRLSRFEPFFLSRNFRLHLRYQLGKLFFTFFSCFCVYIVVFLLSVGVGRRVPPFIEVIVYHGNASRFGAADFRLFRLEFCLLWRFYNLVGWGLTALISAETMLNLVTVSALRNSGSSS